MIWPYFFVDENVPLLGSLKVLVKIDSFAVLFECGSPLENEQGGFR